MALRCARWNRTASPPWTPVRDLESPYRPTCSGTPDKGYQPCEFTFRPMHLGESMVLEDHKVHRGRHVAMASRTSDRIQHLGEHNISSLPSGMIKNLLTSRRPGDSHLVSIRPSPADHVPHHTPTDRDREEKMLSSTAAVGIGTLALTASTTFSSTPCSFVLHKKRETAPISPKTKP